MPITRGWKRLAVRTVIGVLAVTGVAGAAAATWFGVGAWQEANEIEARMALESGPQTTLVYDADDHLSFALYREHRIVVPLAAMSPTLVGAVLAAEDHRFFEHSGVDVWRIVAAAVANARAGRIVQGGSTITQQLVRDLVLDRRRTFRRKIVEAILARRLERRIGKRAILESYLNRVYLGSGYYGVEAAARGYFGTSASGLDAAQAATLAAIIKGPSLYSPAVAPARARDRRDWVLSRMRTLHLLDRDAYRKAVAEPVMSRAGRQARMVDPMVQDVGPYFNELVRRELVARFGIEAVMTGGLRVYTTLNPVLQREAERAVADRLAAVPGGGDGPAPLQGALVAIDPRTGAVRALVGGRDFDASPFNRAVDARRQPGSAFKPFVYARAIENGLTPASRLRGLDEPIESAEGPWLPDGEHEATQISLHDALVVSSNRAAAHLITSLGIAPTLDLVRRFGIESPQPAVPSVALGTGGVTLLELTSAYGVFAAGGAWVAPHLIRRVDDVLGNVVWTPQPERPRRVISEGAAYLMTRMLADVVDHGTGITARYEGFRRPAAGKTGTSDGYADAWFIGYTPELAAGVWFGYDHPRPIMRRGYASVVAVPAWAHFMAAATANTPVSRFTRPDSVVAVRICRLSGLRATEGCEHQQSWVSVALSMDALSSSGGTVADPASDGGAVVDGLAIRGRLPPPCPLHGGRGDVAAATALVAAVAPGGDVVHVKQ